MENCCCESPSIKLNNTHCMKLPVNAFLLHDKDGYGIIVMNKNTAIACFEINFCPICGRKLNV